jgi:uncharacterized protein YbjT (DUF2867 family)
MRPEEKDNETLSIVIAGATGAVGTCLLRYASSLPGVRVYALVRRKGSVTEPGVSEVFFDYENPASYDDVFRETSCDVLLLCLGSTTKKAGREGLVRVERDYPSQLAQALARVNPDAHVGFVSSMGADKPVGVYLKAKADAEKALMACGLRCVIARPSFLLAHRTEFRLAELVVAKVVALPMLWFLRHCAPRSRTLWKYAPVRVEDVAHALFQAVMGVEQGACLILEGFDLQAASASSSGKGNDNL